MSTSFGEALRDKLILLHLATPDTIKGCTNYEIEEIMQRQQVSTLPNLYRSFLQTMGHCAGELFTAVVRLVEPSGTYPASRILQLNKAKVKGFFRVWLL